MKRSLMLVAMLAPLALAACDRPSTPSSVVVTAPAPEPVSQPPVVVQVPVAVPGPAGPQGERGEEGRKGERGEESRKEGERERERSHDTVVLVPVPAEKKRD